MSPEQCQALLAALEPFEDPAISTEDERLCAQIVREACEDISRGGDLMPPPAGAPLKKRLLRRVDVAWFHHLTPRDRKVTAPS